MTVVHAVLATVSAALLWMVEVDVLGFRPSLAAVCVVVPVIVAWGRSDAV